MKKTFCFDRKVSSVGTEKTGSSRDGFSLLRTVCEAGCRVQTDWETESAFVVIFGA